MTNSRLVQIQTTCRCQNKCDSRIEFDLERVVIILKKGRKCLLPACSLFPKLFS